MRVPGLLLLLALTSACARQGAPEASARGRVTERAVDEEGLMIREIDVDGDGRADVRTFFRDQEDGGARIEVRKERDLDYDGRADVVSTFDDGGALVTEQMDSDFDGVLDWTDHYKDGVRVMAEMDSNFDGRSDMFFYYAVGDGGVPRIDRKERDTDGDGRIDVWERFDAEGNVIRTGRDVDGDGKMDLRDQ